VEHTFAGVAQWTDLVLIATFAASGLRISIALMEIVVGMAAATIISRYSGSEAMGSNLPWLAFIASSGAGAAAGIEDNHARIGQAVGDLEFLAQDAIDTLDLVTDDFLGSVPDTPASMTPREGIWYRRGLSGTSSVGCRENLSTVNRPPSGKPAPRFARSITQRTRGERDFPSPVSRLSSTG
jgi:hypothetical protein